MIISVVGLGYMGLPTALLLAKSGIKVFGFDIDKEKIKQLNNKILPFQENGLQELFNEATTFSAVEQLSVSDVFIITVPTPLSKDKTCDLRFVLSAVKTISHVLKDNDLVILESTVPPKTTEDIVKPILDKTKKKFFLSFVSEKAIPGNTIYEMQRNQRIIGGINKESAEKTKEIYSHFVKAPIHLTDCKTAETVKLMENTYRDVNIALANEFAQIAETTGIDVYEAIRLSNLHPRVHIHNPGPGVGGHCIPIDPWFLSPKDTKLIKTARQINDSQPKQIVKKIKEIIKEEENPVVSLLGLSYKANIDDYRESPTLKIKELLEQEKITVRIHDPLVKSYIDNIENFKDSVKDSDCLVFVTDHSTFNEIDIANINTMRSKKILDTRNSVEQSKWLSQGFKVYTLGK